MPASATIREWFPVELDQRFFGPIPMFFICNFCITQEVSILPQQHSWNDFAFSQTFSNYSWKRL